MAGALAGLPVGLCSLRGAPIALEQRDSPARLERVLEADLGMDVVAAGGARQAQQQQQQQVAAGAAAAAAAFDGRTAAVGGSVPRGAIRCGLETARGLSHRQVRRLVPQVGGAKTGPGVVWKMGAIHANANANANHVVVFYFFFFFFRRGLRGLPGRSEIRPSRAAAVIDIDIDTDTGIDHREASRTQRFLQGAPKPGPSRGRGKLVILKCEEYVNYIIY